MVIAWWNTRVLIILGYQDQYSGVHLQFKKKQHILAKVNCKYEHIEN